LLFGEYRDDVTRFLGSFRAQSPKFSQRRTFWTTTTAQGNLARWDLLHRFGWHIRRQLRDATMKENFDLQRQSLHGVTVLSYDELFRKVED